MSRKPESPLPYPFNDCAGLTLADAYRQAQAQDGLVKIKLPFGEPAWLATRYQDVRQVLSDRRFSRTEATRRDDPPRAFPRIGGGIVMMDPPELTRIRRLVGQAFTRQRVEGLRPSVAGHAEALLDAMVRAGPPADLVCDFALPLPMTVICMLLGVPLQDQVEFKEWSDSFLSTSLATAEQTQRNMGKLSDYIMGLIQKRRRQPEDDLLTRLMQAHDIEDRLGEKELIPLCIAILVGGYEPPTSQISNSIYTLLSHPAEYASLKDHPDRVDGAVEELLRYVPLASGAMFVHYATEDVEIGATLVRAGEPVFASIGAANRDSRQFSEADTLDLQRDAGGHFGFGHGLHGCLGAALGRLELQEALRALMQRLPDLHLIGEPTWKAETFFRGPVTMTVGW